MRTNSKAVRELVKAHILETMSAEDIKATIKNLQYNNQSVYFAGKEMVQGGSFLCYYTDVVDFLNSLGINPENKEYSNAKSWELYKHLIASEIEKIVS